MAIVDAPGLGGESADAAAILLGRRLGRRDRFEAVGLLLGILGVLVVVAVTLGAGTPS